MMSAIPMLLSSLISGFFSTMNMWCVKWSHTRFHLNDTYMVLLMTFWMLLFTYLIYYKQMKNASVYIVITIVCICLIIYCIRTQFLIDDEQFLNGMIPHHSMAILMAQNIKKKTTDKDIKKLAENIIDTQTKEIELMDSLLRNKKMNNISD